MRRRLAFENLETKTLLGACLAALPHPIVRPPAAVQPHPAPRTGPEGDPGDLPIDDSPIVLPPVPPSGPVGPG